MLALGTFSKILAPSLRLGWIQATPDLMTTLLASGLLVSGGNFNHFTSHLVRKLMESGELAANVAALRASYTERAQAIVEAQIAETYIINQIHLQTLIATKAARCVHAAAGRPDDDAVCRCGLPMQR